MSRSRVPRRTEPGWDSGAAMPEFAASSTDAPRKVRRVGFEGHDFSCGDYTIDEVDCRKSVTQKESNMDRRQFIGAGVAGLAAQAGQAQSFVQSPAFTEGRGYRQGQGPARRFDRLRMVRQDRFAAAGPDFAGGSRVALRCRQEHAARGRKHCRRPPAFEEKCRGSIPTIARCWRRRISTSS